MHRKLSDVELVAFDLETTGLHPVGCRIVEFGAVRFRLDGREIDRFEQLVNPGCPIPDQVSRIHGITDRHVRGMPPVTEVLPRFLEFLGGADAILLAHNADFDLRFLAVALAQCGTKTLTHHVLDTLVIARQRQRRLANHKLETLAVHFRVADREDHRALSDSRLLKSVFLKLIAGRPKPSVVGDLFRIAPPRTCDDCRTRPAEVPPKFKRLAEAIENGRAITMTYDSGMGGPARREVTPRGLFESGGRLYLAARCHRDGLDKTYRLDRIREFVSMPFQRT